jgi:SHAQKYF class myb-like DNA-binding protein
MDMMSSLQGVSPGKLLQGVSPNKLLQNLISPDKMGGADDMVWLDIMPLEEHQSSHPGAALQQSLSGSPAMGRQVSGDNAIPSPGLVHVKYDEDGEDDEDDGGVAEDDDEDGLLTGFSKSTATGRWTNREHGVFAEAMKLFPKNWKKISSYVKTRTAVQCRTHAQKVWKGAGFGGSLSDMQDEQSWLVALESHGQVWDGNGESTTTKTSEKRRNKEGRVASYTRWSALEHTMFVEGMTQWPKNWKKIAELVKTRTSVQCRTHAQKVWKGEEAEKEKQKEKALAALSQNGKSKKKSTPSYTRWTEQEHLLFVEGMKQWPKNWKKIAEVVKTRTSLQCRTHAQKVWKGPLDLSVGRGEPDENLLTASMGEPGSPTTVGQHGQQQFGSASKSRSAASDQSLATSNAHNIGLVLSHQDLKTYRPMSSPIKTKGRKHSQRGSANKADRESSPHHSTDLEGPTLAGLDDLILCMVDDHLSTGAVSSLRATNPTSPGLAALAGSPMTLLSKQFSTSLFTDLSVKTGPFGQASPGKGFGVCTPKFQDITKAPSPTPPTDRARTPPSNKQPSPPPRRRRRTDRSAEKPSARLASAEKKKPSSAKKLAFDKKLVIGKLVQGTEGVQGNEGQSILDLNRGGAHGEKKVKLENPGGLVGDPTDKPNVLSGHNPTDSLIECAMDEDEDLSDKAFERRHHYMEVAERALRNDDFSGVEWVQCDACSKWRKMDSRSFSATNTDGDDGYYCGNRARPSTYHCHRLCSWLAEQVGKQNATTFAQWGVSTVTDVVEKPELLKKIASMGYTFDDTTMEFSKIGETAVDLQGK